MRLKYKVNNRMTEQSNKAAGLDCGVKPPIMEWNTYKGKNEEPR